VAGERGFKREKVGEVGVAGGSSGHRWPKIREKRRGYRRDREKREEKKREKEERERDSRGRREGKRDQ